MPRLYARPGAIHNAFGGQFAAFATDAIDNQALFAKTGKLPMPILAIGGDHSYGASLAAELETVASNVRSAVITNSGHWIMEEQPDQALALLVPFVDSAPTQAAQKRLTSSEIDALPARVAGAGTSGLPGVSTRVLYGDPAAHGLYSIELSVPPNTVIEAHRHRDDRTATVVAGHWYFGYGSVNDPAAVKSLPPGSFYTEPGGVAHFARTGAESAVVVITGYGPSDTDYVK